MSEIRITHIGGPTALIEVGGWRILTDPTFDPPGKRYFFGWGTTSRKLAGPAVSTDELGEIDAVLVSHEHHGDNLDPTGRELLPTCGTVITTRAGAKKLGVEAVGLNAWQTTTLEKPGKQSITITATPCRHGPVGSEPITGPVIGFALEWAGQENGALWITGDTVLYKGLREVPERLNIGTVIVHLGGVKFRYLSAGFRYTMNAEEAVELFEALDPVKVIPIHYEGWAHFKQGRDAAQRIFDSSSYADRITWLEPGKAEAIAV